MTTAYAIILSAYLIGYFISFGLIMGIDEESPNINSFVAAFFISIASWIMIGLFLSDFIPKNKKESHE